MLKHGVLLISLDFELYWGVRDSRNLMDYKKNLEGAHDAVDAMLQIFSDYQVRATWAAVGFLFFSDREGLLANYPINIPQYVDVGLSPYNYITNQAELSNIHHFAPELIGEIAKTSGQEIATHTFSHYYCLEDGQTYDDFVEDITLALSIAKRSGVTIKTIIFPRNQIRLDYLPVLYKLGIICYRGNEHGWLYSSADQKSIGFARRLLRLFDSYINLSGHNLFDLSDSVPNLPINLPSSSFFRPYNQRLKWFERYKINRIKKSMLNAAINKKVFHLWWHPHNFGVSTKENMEQLDEVLQYYTKLHKEYGMVSLNMSDLVNDY